MEERTKEALVFLLGILLLGTAIANVTVGIPWLQQEGVSAGSGGPGEPKSLAENCDYTFRLDGSTVLATRGDSSGNRFSGTDHKPVIQDAIDDLTSGHYCFNRGTYDIDGSIDFANGNYALVGEEGAVLRRKAGTTAACIIRTDNSDNAGQDNLSFIGLTFDGNGVSPQDIGMLCILNNSDNIRIHRNTFRNGSVAASSINGIHRAGSTGTVTNIFIDSNLFQVKESIRWTLGQGLYITNNRFEHPNINGNVIKIHNTLDILLQGNSIRGNTADLALSTFAADIEDSTRIRIIGNDFQGFGGGGSFLMISNDENKGSNDTLIQSNTFFNGGGTACGVLITDQIGDIADLKQMQVIGNTFRSMSCGVILTGQAGNNTASYNLFVSVTTVFNESPSTPLAAGKTNYYSFNQAYGFTTFINGRISPFSSFQANVGFVTENYGATSVADGGTISHGLVTTPTRVQCATSVSGELCSITALAATTFTVAIKTHAGAAGTTQTIYWEAEA